MAEILTNAIKSGGAASIISSSFVLTVALTDSYIDSLSALVILFNKVKLTLRLKPVETLLYFFFKDKKNEKI